MKPRRKRKRSPVTHARVRSYVFGVRIIVAPSASLADVAAIGDALRACNGVERIEVDDLMGVKL